MNFFERQPRGRPEIYRIKPGEREAVHYQDPQKETSGHCVITVDWKTETTPVVLKYVAYSNSGADSGMEALIQIAREIQIWKQGEGKLGIPGSYVLFKLVGESQEFDPVTGEFRLVTRVGHRKDTREIIFKAKN